MNAGRNENSSYNRGNKMSKAKEGTEEANVANNLIEYKGEYFTAEELGQKMGVTGNFKVMIKGENETWFGKAMKKLRKK